MTRRFLIAFFVLTLAVAHGEQGQKSGSSTKQSSGSKSKATAVQKAGPAVAPGSTVLPKDAVQVSPGIWSAKDADGKVWLYRRTPFSWVKYEPEEEQPAAAGAGRELKATEDGDSVQFERSSPFGTMRWTRKKTELTEDEKAAWERVSAGQKNPPSGAAAKAAVKE